MLRSGKELPLPPIVVPPKEGYIPIDSVIKGGSPPKSKQEVKFLEIYIFLKLHFHSGHQDPKENDGEKERLTHSRGLRLISHCLTSSSKFQNTSKF